MSGDYAMTILGPGHVVMSRDPKDVRAAWQAEMQPMIEQLAAAYGADRYWWAMTRRSRSRVVTRRKQRNHW